MVSESLALFVATKRTPPMSIEDIEKHLDSRPSVPSIEKATTSMPADIFSNVDRCV